MMNAERHEVVILGETLVDLFFEDVENKSGHKHFCFTGTPGGAPANVAANLTGMGIPTSLISGFSNDILGEELKNTLLERNIDLSMSSTHQDTKTALATVTNTSQGERSFRLYLTKSSLEKIDVSSLALPRNLSYFHFGSVLLVFEAGIKATKLLLQQVSSASTIRTYDINIRPDILKMNPKATKEAIDLLNQVDVLKISDEDLVWIQKNVDGNLASPADFLKFGIKLIAYTEGPKGSTLLTPSTSCFVPAPKVKVVDTTGGGDAFMAGILASLAEQNIANREKLHKLDRQTLEKIGAHASESAKCIITQSGGMPPLNFTPIHF